MAELPENDRIAGPFLAANGQTDFPGDFPLIDAPGDPKGNCIVVVREREGARTELVLGDFTIAAATDAAFTLRLVVPALQEDRYFIVGRQKQMRLRAHATGGAIRTLTLEADAREAAARSQEAQRDLRRTVMTAVGEQGFTLPVLAERDRGVAVWDEGALDRFAPAPGKFLAADADGRLVSASGTGGGDALLRTDLAAPTGASLTGTPRGSVLTRLNQLDQMQVEQARAMPPGAIPGLYDAASVWPTRGEPMAALRLAPNLSMTRVLRPSGFVEEIVRRNPGGQAGVNDGWQLWSHRGYAHGRVWNIIRQPLSLGQATTLEFAFRLGLTGDTYPDAYLPTEVNGYGHGNMIVPDGGAIIKLDGGGANLGLVENWPVGVALFGQSLLYDIDFRLLLHGGATEAVKLSHNIIVDGDWGCREIGYLSALIPDVAFQDSTTGMMATNFGDPLGFNMAKLAGDPVAIPMVGETDPNLIQKGNWRTTTSGTVQFYNTEDPTVVATLRNAKGPGIQNQAENLPPYPYNQHGRVHVTDGVTESKFVIYGASAEEVAPFTTTPLPMGDTHIFYNFRSLEYLPGGPL